MSRWILPVGFAFVLCTVSLQAQEGPRRGKIKEVDVEHEVLTLVVDGKDEEFQLSEETQKLITGGSVTRGVALEFPGCRKISCRRQQNR